MQPFEVGHAYLIKTLTLYYVGRVISCDLGWYGWSAPAGYTAPGVYPP